MLNIGFYSNLEINYNLILHRSHMKLKLNLMFVQCNVFISAVKGTFFGNGKQVKRSFFLHEYNFATKKNILTDRFMLTQHNKSESIFQFRHLSLASSADFYNN